MFNIEIRNEKISTYRTITLLAVIFNILFFIFLLYKTGGQKSPLFSLVFILLYTGYRFYVSKKTRKTFFFDEWIYFLLMILWVDNYLMATVNLVLFLLYTVTIQKIIYIVDTSHVKQKNFPWKKYEWHSLNNVILKDNLLTIDFKNNKLMQAEIINGDFDNEEFNAFARARLSEPPLEA